MVLNISISGEAVARLQERASVAGVDVATYAARQLEKLASFATDLAALSGPVAGEVKAEGIGEEGIAALLEEEKHAMRAGRRGG